MTSSLVEWSSDGSQNCIFLGIHVEKVEIAKSVRYIHVQLKINYPPDFSVLNHIIILYKDAHSQENVHR